MVMMVAHCIVLDHNSTAEIMSTLCISGECRQMLAEQALHFSAGMSMLLHPCLPCSLRLAELRPRILMWLSFCQLVKL